MFQKSLTFIGSSSMLSSRRQLSFVEGVRRIVAWLDARDRIHDKDEPVIYGEIIERWKSLSTKASFFGSSDNPKA